jgi:hypothetical protein
MHHEPHHPKRKSKEHMQPRSRGGSNGDNIVSACRLCNSDKDNLTVSEYRCLAAGRKNFRPAQIQFVGESGWKINPRSPYQQQV